MLSIWIPYREDQTRCKKPLPNSLTIRVRSVILFRESTMNSGTANCHPAASAWTQRMICLLRLSGAPVNRRKVISFVTHAFWNIGRETFKKMRGKLPGMPLLCFNPCYALFAKILLTTNRICSLFLGSRDSSTTRGSCRKSSWRNCRPKICASMNNFRRESRSSSLSTWTHRSDKRLSKSTTERPSLNGTTRFRRCGWQRSQRPTSCWSRWKRSRSAIRISSRITISLTSRSICRSWESTLKTRPSDRVWTKYGDTANMPSEIL